MTCEQKILLHWNRFSLSCFLLSASKWQPSCDHEKNQENFRLGRSSVVTTCLGCVQPWVQSQHQPRKQKNPKEISKSFALISLYPLIITVAFWASHSITKIKFVLFLEATVSGFVSLSKGQLTKINK
jgi:hypothetical protein